MITCQGWEQIKAWGDGPCSNEVSGELHSCPFKVELDHCFHISQSAL